MKEAISELIIELEKERNASIELNKKAQCTLDEGFFNGLQTAYKRVIGTLEYILVKKEDK